MRVETKLFLYLFVFFVPVVLMYGFWSKWEEPIGVTALILTALLFALTGFYLWMTGKKLPLRPEDNAAGEIEDAAVARRLRRHHVRRPRDRLVALHHRRRLRGRRRVPVGLRVLLGRVLHLISSLTSQGPGRRPGPCDVVGRSSSGPREPPRRPYDVLR